MAGKDTPAAAATASTSSAAGASADRETIRKLHHDREQLLKCITDLDETADSFSDLMYTAVEKLIELDKYAEQLEKDRDALIQELMAQKKVEDELNLKIDELEKLGEKQRADLDRISRDHAAEIKASWERGRAHGRRELKSGF